jgi:tRNA-modifying protein YgfZ
LRARGYRATFPGMTQIARLTARSVVEVTGADRVTFLQGLVSNDVGQAAPGRAIWAALLTPQGKWTADFFIFSDGERLLLDCEAAQAMQLIQRLSRYRLRAAVGLAETPLVVHVAWSGPPPEAPIVAPDPRLEEAGWRLLSPAPLETNATEADWDLHRLELGLPDGSRDLEAEKSVLLEAGFDELNGVSWTKGCYMGQELTARTRYRGLIKRRLVPVMAEGALPPPGTPVMLDGREVGAVRSSHDTLGLATLRLDAIGAEGLVAGDAVLHTRVQGWMRLPGRGVEE